MEELNFLHYISVRNSRQSNNDITHDMNNKIEQIHAMLREVLQKNNTPPELDNLVNDNEVTIIDIENESKEVEIVDDEDKLADK